MPRNCAIEFRMQIGTFTKAPASRLHIACQNESKKWEYLHSSYEDVRNQHVTRSNRFRKAFK